MPMLGALITPHPPVLLPEVGGGREREISATGNALREAAAEVARWNPEVLIVASPHTILYGDYFHIAPGEGAVGSMAAFGAPQVRIAVSYDVPLRQAILRQAESAGLRAGTLGQRDPDLDHGVLIPLYFLRRAGVHCPIVRMGLSGFSALDHYRLGQCVANAVAELGRRAVFVASGDLSHKLKVDGPYGFAPEGPVFDEAVTRAMASGNFLEFLTMDPTLCERAAECGLRAFQMMAGALDGQAVRPRLLSHEGTFGVGYGVALFPVTGRDDTRRYAAVCERIQKERLAARRAQGGSLGAVGAPFAGNLCPAGSYSADPAGRSARRTDRADSRRLCLAAQGRTASGVHRDDCAHRGKRCQGNCAKRRFGRDTGSAVPAGAH